ncbi:MAG TPA: peptide ABC transporter ATP-binding protein [Weissella confusa]|nr:peptide ABC transporter ATP-binding protein [Weissella confusa]
MLKLEHIDKQYAQHHALKDINVTFNPHETTVIVGPSGSGKSTFLRSLNKLEEINSGQIKINGWDLVDPKNNIDKTRETIGMVFQHFNLFPHLTVLQNMMLAPVEVAGQTKAEAEETARALLARVGLADKADVKPNTLSGGQKQRVAIARALAMNPKIMLFDEPTSALDPEMVGEVLKTMRELAQEGMTMLVVTHEMGFAREVASKIWFMADGDMTQYDNPEAFFENPDSERAQSFLAKML